MALAGCLNLTNVTLPNSLTSISDYEFNDCSNLANISVGTSVASIGSAAFAGCASLTNVTLPDRVTSIGSYSFHGCTSLKNIVIPDNVSNIAGGAFYYCTNLTAVTLGTNVASIGYEAFCSCSSLTSIRIPNSVVDLGDEAFYSCTSLTNVIIGNSVTNLGDNTFYLCTRLKSVTIGTSIARIGYMALAGCFSLTSVTIPNSLTSIADDAFASCTNLTGIFFKGNAPDLGGASVFYNCNKAMVFYLAGTTGWSASFGGRPTAMWNSPPIVAAQPPNQTVLVGSNVIIAVAAVSTPPLVYQWRFNGATLSNGGSISGATTTSLTIGNAQPTNAGNYTVVVTNAFGSVTSSVAVLTVIPPNHDFYITNATLTVDGYANFEVVVPSNGVYSLLISTNLRNWESVDTLAGPTNRFFISSYPTTMAEMGNTFVRAAEGLVPQYRFYLNFGTTAGTLVAGTASVPFPQSVQNYSAFLEVNRLASPAAMTNVFFTGPPGSGLTNALPEGSDLDPENYGANYWSPTPPNLSVPTPGNWTINYGGTNLLFAQPNALDRFVVPHPTIVVSNGMLVSVNWVYRNPTTGQALEGRPAFFRDITVEVFGGFPLQRVYDSNDLTRDTTNHVFSSSLLWNEVNSLSFSYHDDVGRNGNRYRVLFAK